uniref:Uncharacterized protein n=1 Tax=Anguilla anguilla TaxID=7936 RepID=A0A0E9UCE3_ANGAN
MICTIPSVLVDPGGILCRSGTRGSMVQQTPLLFAAAGTAGAAMEFMGMLSCSPCLKTWVTMTSPLAVVTETDILSTTISCEL